MRHRRERRERGVNGGRPGERAQGAEAGRVAVRAGAHMAEQGRRVCGRVRAGGGELRSAARRSRAGQRRVAWQCTWGARASGTGAARPRARMWRNVRGREQRVVAGGAARRAEHRVRVCARASRRSRGRGGRAKRARQRRKEGEKGEKEEKWRKEKEKEKERGEKRERKRRVGADRGEWSRVADRRPSGAGWDDGEEKEGGYGRWKKMERQWKTDVKTAEIRELGLELNDENF